MDPIISGVKVQDQLLGNALKAGHELLDEHPRHRPCRVPIRPVFKSTQRWTAGQRITALDHGLPHQIAPQRVVIVEVFVTQGQPVNALAQEVDLAMSDLTGIPRILDHRVQRLE